ncbi:MAG: glycosyltransferase [Gemmatimonadota bacterium]
MPVKPPDAHHRPVFLDPSGKRWTRLRRLALLAGAVATVLFAVLVANVLIPPALPAFASFVRGETATSVPPHGRQHERARRAARARLMASVDLAARTQRARGGHGRVAIHNMAAAARPTMQVAAAPLDADTSDVVGFYVNWDDNSFVSFASHAASMDAVVCEWLFLAPHGDSIVTKIDPRVFDVANALPRAQRPRVLAMLSNFSSQDRRFDEGSLRRFLLSKQTRASAIARMTALVTHRGLGGIVVDFENVPDDLGPSLTSFLQQLHDALTPMGASLGQAVGADDNLALIQRYATVDDRVYLMLYDEHYDRSAPGPVASQGWYEAKLRLLLSVVPPAKAVLALGAYGYDWNDAGPRNSAIEMTFQDVMAAARDHSAHVAFDPQSLTPYLAWTEADSTDHVVWYLDGVTAWNEVVASRALGVAGHAVWRLGSEDPSIWQFLGQDRAQATALTVMPRGGYDVEFRGEGEILRVDAMPDTGIRVLRVDSATQRIVAESLAVLPSNWVVRRMGASAHRVALTFDDGPDGRWTPDILDTLTARQVPATFFIIGHNAQGNIRLTRRIYDEGHEIGNHTFTHPNLALTDPWVTRVELGATERLIEAVTDRRSVLFRPPYFGDAEPTTRDALGPIAIANALGYLTAGVHVDAEDWRISDPVRIVRQVLDERVRGNVVLLHDGGGVRAGTVAALGPLIDSLRARGDTLVLLSDLAGITRDAAMPALPASGATTRFIELASYALIGGTQRFFFDVFMLAAILGIARLIFLLSLALVQRFRTGPTLPHYTPDVTVVVPAWNEEKVIHRTIASLLAQEYDGEVDVVVVDDGSPDATYAVALAAYGTHPRVAILTKSNGGKSTALNHGIARARGDIVVCLDADTIFQPDTIACLVAPLADPRVGAVAGNAKVGNRLNIVTRWQALEYVTSQNVDRRAFSLLNAITVVPGAVGAWRKALVLAAGGFSHDTLAEDQDLTIAIRRMGYTVAYADRAIAWTEAPDTLGGLARQRFRWSFGTLQCAWKYRGELFRRRSGTLGWLALPNTWLFQLLFTALSPLADVAFVWSLVSVWIDRLQHGATYADVAVQHLAEYYALFLLVDWGAAIVAFMIEPDEDRKLTWLIFLQRFVYRQVMYWVVLKAFASAFRGRVVGWGRLERKATVTIQTA